MTYESHLTGNDHLSAESREGGREGVERGGKGKQQYVTPVSTGIL